MKKITTWSILLVMALVLTACAGTTGKKVDVKCPSCGYEFDVERYGR